MPVTTPPPLPRPSWDDLSARAKLSTAQRRVLAHVELADSPLTASEVGSALGLHHNTVREHLDALVDSGFIRVTSTHTGRRGRPALRYSATAPEPGQVLDGYLSLLDSVAAVLGDNESGRAFADEIGRQWAARTETSAPQRSGTGPMTDAERLQALLPGLAAMGFAPELVPGGIVLRACPLVTSRRVPAELVCRMHQAFLNEDLRRNDAATDPQGKAGPRAGAVVLPLRPEGCRILLRPDGPAR